MVAAVLIVGVAILVSVEDAESESATEIQKRIPVTRNQSLQMPHHAAAICGERKSLGRRGLQNSDKEGQ